MLARTRRGDRTHLREEFVSRCAAVAPAVNVHSMPRARNEDSGALRLLTFNIQVGIHTGRYRHYVTHGWRHLLPNGSRTDNLRRIADLVAGYDVVALQEVDGGSLRSGFINQVEYLADRAQFPYWYAQLNRDLGPFARHGNGVLSRVEPRVLEDHKLPGAIPGRGAILMHLPHAGVEVTIVLVHLSLGARSRQRQLDYLRGLIDGRPYVVVMGDLNGDADAWLEGDALSGTGLRSVASGQPTWPAWRPQFNLDHVLVSADLEVSDCSVVDCQVSDHRPIAVTLRLAS
jgi:endonuclease/exonuclease/phosphatase family metal-dependent hydrolase